MQICDGKDSVLDMQIFHRTKRFSLDCKVNVHASQPRPHGFLSSKDPGDEVARIRDTGAGATEGLLIYPRVYFLGVSVWAGACLVAILVKEKYRFGNSCFLYRNPNFDDFGLVRRKFGNFCLQNANSWYFFDVDFSPA